MTSVQHEFISGRTLDLQRSCTGRELTASGVDMCHIAVSVIIPLWNGERYLGECLHSVLSQTLQNIEVIIIDDASMDGSMVLADSYAARDARIKVLHLHEKQGASVARNLGLERARAEFIAFMDSDDRYPSVDVLEQLYSKARATGAQICGGSLILMDDASRVIKWKVPGQFFEEERFYNYREYQYEGGFYRFLYRRVFLEVHQLRFPPRLRFEDPLFFVQAMLTAGSFYAMPFISYAYRKGHKCDTWGAKEAQDHVQGVRELLKLSRERRLESLHYSMAKNFLDSLRYRMGSMGPWRKLAEAFVVRREVDWEYIQRENQKNKIQVSFWKMFWAAIAPARSRLPKCRPRNVLFLGSVSK